MGRDIKKVRCLTTQEGLHFDFFFEFFDDDNEKLEHVLLNKDAGEKVYKILKPFFEDQ